MLDVLSLLFPFLGMVVLVMFFGWWVWVRNRTAREKVATLAEMRTRMLDKFGTSQEFIDFLKTTEGHHYLSSLSEPPRSHPARKIIATISTAIIIMMVSVAMIALAFLSGFQDPMEEPPFFLGMIGLFLSTGFIISAVVSHLLSKAYGLMPPSAGKNPSATDETPPS